MKALTIDSRPGNAITVSVSHNGQEYTVDVGIYDFNRDGGLVSLYPGDVDDLCEKLYEARDIIVSELRSNVKIVCDPLAGTR